MPILNYTTSISPLKTEAEIRQILVKHGARRILAEYDNEGNITGLAFEIETPDGRTRIKLPVRAERVQKVLQRQWNKSLGVSYKQTTLEHARRVAWRIMKDWLEAQMAILDADMVDFTEIFLPYVQTPGGQTLYDSFKMSLSLPEGSEVCNDSHP